MQNDVYTPRSVSRLGAATSVECLAEYVQLGDSAWYLPLSSSEGVTESPAQSFAACVDLCTTARCMLATYDYVTKTCSVRVAQDNIYEG